MEVRKRGGGRYVRERVEVCMREGGKEGGVRKREGGRRVEVRKRGWKEGGGT